MSGGGDAAPVAGLLLGVGILAAVLALLHRTLRVAVEIRRYVDDIGVAAEGIVRNVEGAGELGRTRELAAAVPELALGYLQSNGGRAG